jgi:nucleotide-binding universal stress UspA family protein
VSTTILIGVDAGERSQDAIAFAQQLADASSAHLVVANAYPYSDVPHRVANAHHREQLRDRSLELVHELRSRLDLPEKRSTVKIVADPSPAPALHAMAENEDAALLIVGCSHTGRIRRVLPGSTAERLIHRTPCSLAVVPNGYREQAEPIRRVGVAYNGTLEARAAVFAAAELARGLGAELEVIGVADALAYDAPALMGGPSVAPPPVDIAHHVQDNLDAMIAELPADVKATAKCMTGDPAELLADYSRHLGLLVTGSRGYGPMRSVLAGGVSGRVLRTAHCPVIIVPRGIEAPFSDLFPAMATTAG